MSGRYFHGLHLRLNNLYSDYCQDCNLPLWRGNEGEDFVNQDFNLALNSNSTVFKALIKSVNDAYQKLHSKGNYNAQDIQEYSQLIDATNDVFQNALKKGVGDNVVPAKMKQALDEDVFVFSALKTHAQLFEASRLLQTEDGKVKSFNAFSQDVAKIKADYNQSYLEAEYQFAQSSAQQAANWAGIEENKGRYNLQYRTANDDRVRDSHAILNGITLPSEDTFWSEYYPPNGWRCRCVAVEVLKDKYATDDSVAAIEKGQSATSQIGKDGKNRLEIFRFNPGKQKVIFPPNHPYQPKGCGGDVSSLKGTPAFFLSADNGKCKAKSEAKKLFDEKQKNIRDKYLELLEQNKNRSVSKSFGGNQIAIKFNNRDGNKHFINDMLNKTNRITEKDLDKIHQYVKSSKPMPRIDLYKKKNDGIERFYYLYDEKRDVYYHIAERPEKRKNGLVNIHRFLYGVTETI